MVGGWVGKIKDAFLGRLVKEKYLLPISYVLDSI